MEKTTKFEISEIRYYCTGAFKMPIGVLKTADEKKQVVGYLSPFRNYAFQVSDTFKGEGDRGSTPVMGLLNIIGAVPPAEHQACNLTWPETIQYMMKSLATMACIERQARQLYDHEAENPFIPLKYVDTRATTEEMKLSDGRRPKNYFATKMDVYILEVLRYLQYEHYTDLTEEVESK